MENTPNTEDVSQMFQSGNEQSDVKTTIKKMAELIVEKSVELEFTKKVLTERTETLESLKAQLCQIMQQNGFSSCKLENGLNPSTMLKTKYFDAAGLDNEQKFGWLNDNDLGDIIKPTVNFNTLQSTLKAFVLQGHDIPDIFNVVEVQSIRMNGKSKYLAMKS